MPCGMFVHHLRHRQRLRYGEQDIRLSVGTTAARHGCPAAPVKEGWARVVSHRGGHNGNPSVGGLLSLRMGDLLGSWGILSAYPLPNPLTPRPHASSLVKSDMIERWQSIALRRKNGSAPQNGEGGRSRRVAQEQARDRRGLRDRSGLDGATPFASEKRGRPRGDCGRRACGRRASGGPARC